MKLEPSDHTLLIQIHTRLDSLERRLFGNGQPGVIRDMSTRLHRLEKFRWVAMGVIVLGVFLLGLNSDYLIGALAR